MKYCSDWISVFHQRHMRHEIIGVFFSYFIVNNMKGFIFLLTDLYCVVWKRMTISSSYSFSLDIASHIDLLIKVLSHNSWFGCWNVPADIDKGMKTQRKPKSGVRNTYFCVVQSQLESMLCVCAGLLADLALFAPSTSLSILPCCPPSDNLESFISVVWTHRKLSVIYSVW